jgi:hypothetical protein
VEDIELDGVYIAIGGQGVTKTINLNSTNQTLTGVTNYPDDSPWVTVPAANSGKTYIYSGLSVTPDYIRIAPVIGEEKCQESDAITIIETCSFY